MLLPIVSDISEMKEDVKNVSSIQNMHTRALHQTQIVVKESATLLKHVQVNSFPNLEKQLGNMIIDSINQHATQILALRGDVSQRSDTQIHVMDDLANRNNMNHETLKESVENVKTQHEMDMRIITAELKQSESKVSASMGVVETLVTQLTEH